jgi:predicted DsbA family dithiol-disulfide isomerase
VDGVPTVAIDGRYVALGNEQPEILVNADKLIKKVRAERAKAAPAPKAK